MAVSTGGKIANLDEHIEGRSPWQDSWDRLRRNKFAIVGLVIIVLNVLMAVSAPAIAPKPYEKQNLINNNAAPQWVTSLFPTMIPKGQPGGYVNIVSVEEYPMGADSLGRDLLSRIIYGAQISLAVAFIGPIVSMAIGLSMGLLAGYAGGLVDTLIMRVVDIFYAFPTLLVIILMMATFRGAFNEASSQGTLGFQLYLLDKSMGGMLFIFIGIGLTSWVGLARLTRGQVLSVRENEYVTAAKSLGAGDRTIVFKHILPNILGPIIVAETLAIPTYIRFEAFLSFIGLGVNPPRPSWGAMISQGAQSIATYPNQAIFPALALFILMFAFNFLGDGLRDALDPRMRGID
ncbi:ABC transporter permease [Anaerolineales bacterium]